MHVWGQLGRVEGSGWEVAVGFEAHDVVEFVQEGGADGFGAGFVEDGSGWLLR